MGGRLTLSYYFAFAAFPGPDFCFSMKALIASCCWRLAFASNWTEVPSWEDPQPATNDKEPITAPVNGNMNK